MNIQRFTAYRRNISNRDTHNSLQKNNDSDHHFEGVMWSDGTVTLRWLTACKSHSVWSSIQECLAIHGHPEYGTEIIWHDGEAPKEWIKQCEENKMTNKSKPYSEEEFEEIKGWANGTGGSFGGKSLLDINEYFHRLIATVEKWKNKHDTVLEKYHSQDTDAKIRKLQKENTELKAKIHKIEKENFDASFQCGLKEKMTNQEKQELAEYMAEKVLEDSGDKKVIKIYFDKYGQKHTVFTAWEKFIFSPEGFFTVWDACIKKFPKINIILISRLGDFECTIDEEIQHPEWIEEHCICDTSSKNRYEAFYKAIKEIYENNN